MAPETRAIVWLRPDYTGEGTAASREGVRYSGRNTLDGGMHETRSGRDDRREDRQAHDQPEHVLRSRGEGEPGGDWWLSYL